MSLGIVAQTEGEKQISELKVGEQDDYKWTQDQIEKPVCAKVCLCYRIQRKSVMAQFKANAIELCVEWCTPSAEISAVNHSSSIPTSGF